MHIFKIAFNLNKNADISIFLKKKEGKPKGYFFTDFLRICLYIQVQKSKHIYEDLKTT